MLTPITPEEVNELPAPVRERYLLIFAEINRRVTVEKVLGKLKGASPFTEISKRVIAKEDSPDVS